MGEPTDSFLSIGHANLLANMLSSRTNSGVADARCHWSRYHFKFSTSQLYYLQVSQGSLL